MLRQRSIIAKESGRLLVLYQKRQPEIYINNYLIHKELSKCSQLWIVGGLENKSVEMVWRRVALFSTLHFVA